MLNLHLVFGVSLTNRQEPVTNNLDRNGSGLIICTREEREDWEIQLEDAMFLLQNQLGLEVNSLKEIEKKMTTYTANYGHPQKIWDPDHTFYKSLVGKFLLHGHKTTRTPRSLQVTSISSTSWGIPYSSSLFLGTITCRRAVYRTNCDILYTKLGNVSCGVSRKSQ